MTIATEESSFVTGTLVYFVPPADGSKPWTDVNAAIKEGVGRNWTIQEHVLEIENLRGKEDSVALDVNGFQFFKSPAAHRAFNVDADIEKEYYPESIELAKKLTGASRVVVFDHSELSEPGFIVTII